MDLNKQTVKALLGVACGSIAFAAALLHLSTVAGAVVWLLGVLAPLLGRQVDPGLAVKQHPVIQHDPPPVRGHNARDALEGHALAAAGGPQ